MWAPGKVAVATATRLALACAPAPSRAPILNILNTGLWPPTAPAPRGWGGRGGEGGVGPILLPRKSWGWGAARPLCPLSHDSSALAPGASRLKRTHRRRGPTHPVPLSLTRGLAPAARTVRRGPRPAK